MTRGLVVGSMLGMAAAMMMNKQSSNNQNTNNQSTNNTNMNNQNNTQPHGSDIIITDILR